MCTEGWDPIMALAACHFVIDYCSDTQEYTKEIGDMASIVTISNMQDEFSCTYKIMSSTGAPGFNLDAREFATLTAWDDGSRPNVQSEEHPEVYAYYSYYMAPAFLFYWVEYELSQVTVFEDTTWPNPAVHPVFTQCEAGCAQGSLPRRTVGRGEDKMYVSAQDILADITIKRAEFDNWEMVAESVKRFSE